MKSAVGPFLLLFVALSCAAIAFEDETHCIPGSSFKLSCNTCRCQESGIKSGSRCINRGCSPFPPIYDASTKCVPGTIFKQDCNSCMCGYGGTVGSSGCTQMGCLHFHP